MSVIGDGESVRLPLRARSSGVKRPLVLRWKNIGEAETGGVTAGEMALEERGTEAVELDRYTPDTRVCDIGAECWTVGSRGEVARGVVDGVRSSDSKCRSCGVIGRGMPGIYPGRRGVGDVVGARGNGEAR